MCVLFSTNLPDVHHLYRKWFTDEENAAAASSSRNTKNSTYDDGNKHIHIHIFEQLS